MYSLILLTAMSTSPAQPQGIFGLRGSCHGTVAAASTGCAGAHIRTRVRAVVETTIRRPVATLLANRPRLFARGGCGGAVAAASTGCSGGVAVAVAPAPPAYQPMPQPPELEAGILGKRIERMAVHRQLRVALRNGNLTPEQAKIARRALDDPDVYEAAVSKVTHDLKAMKLPVGSGKVGKIGDGTILKMLLDNLPAIIDAIKQILSLFSMGIIDQHTMYAMIAELLEPYRIVFTC